MIGNVLRLGGHRELLERYKRVTPREQQRIYYSLESFVYHHVPTYKMSLFYLVERAYVSGKMSVLVKNETLTTVPSLD